MSILLCYYGTYNKWYKKNPKYDSIAYVFDIDNFPNEEKSNFKQIQYPIQPFNTLIPELNSIHQSERKSRIISYVIDEMDKVVDKYYNEYSCVIFLSFSHILCHPQLPKGKQQVNFYNYCNYNYKYPTTLSIEIVSNLCVRINGSVLQNIYTINSEWRKVLFSLLFNNKVVNYEDISIIEPKNDVAFFIPSVINTSNKPLDYSPYRSVFTVEERLQQTINQCLSLPKDVDSFVCEGSHLDLNHLEKLSQCTTVVLFNNLNSEGYYYANECLNKSMYEIHVMCYMLKNTDYLWSFKFGGRYSISNTFLLSELIRSDKLSLKLISKNYSYGKKDIVECILYLIPILYKNKIIQLFEEMLQTGTGSIETLLYDAIINNNIPYYELEMLNIIGYDAIEGFLHIT
jgi:hypothetical protein